MISVGWKGSVSLKDYVNRRSSVSTVIDNILIDLPIPLLLEGKMKIVPPASSNPGVVGMSYDYAFRWEASRRSRNVIDTGWVVDKLFHDSIAKGFLKEAHDFVSQHVTRDEVADDSMRELCRHAVRMAHLEGSARTDHPVGDDVGADLPCEIEDTSLLIANSPFSMIRPSTRLILNPVFPFVAREICRGADADIVVGRILVDLKTTTNPKVSPPDLRQIVGYHMLGKLCREREITVCSQWTGQPLPPWPEIGSLMLYYARYMTGVQLKTSDLEGHPGWSRAYDQFKRGIDG